MSFADADGTLKEKVLSGAQTTPHLVGFSFSADHEKRIAASFL